MSPIHGDIMAGVTTSVKNLLEFVVVCVDSFQKLVSELSDQMRKMVLALPPCLQSNRVTAYMLNDGVIINDETVNPLTASLPFKVLEKRKYTKTGKDIQVWKLDTDMAQFTSFMTLGLFRIAAGQGHSEFGRASEVSFLTVKAGAQERHLGETLMFRYLEQSGWDQRWAWLVAKETLQRDLDSAMSRLIFNSGIASQQEISDLGQQQAARVGVERVRLAVSHLENLLKLHPNEETRFQALFETYPFLLSTWGKVTPKPFLRWGEPPDGEAAWRVPDFLVAELDGSCTLVEIESAGKPVFTENNDIRPTQYVTQAENQVRRWDQIIRKNPEIAKLYPGIEYYKSRVVIGRSYHPAFPSYVAFQAELASLNEQRARIRFETYDVLLEESRAALNFIELVFLGIPLPSTR
jgi:hypothetical protein